MTKPDAELIFQECGQCTWVSIEYLKVKNVIVLRGKEAQSTFNGDLVGFIKVPQQGGFCF